LQASPAPSAFGQVTQQFQVNAADLASNRMLRVHGFGNLRAGATSSVVEFRFVLGTLVLASLGIGTVAIEANAVYQWSLTGILLTGVQAGQARAALAGSFGPDTGINHAPAVNSEQTAMGLVGANAYVTLPDPLPPVTTVNLQGRHSTSYANQALTGFGSTYEHGPGS